MNLKNPVFIFHDDGRVELKGVVFKRFLYGIGYRRGSCVNIEIDGRNENKVRQMLGSESPKMKIKFIPCGKF